MPLVQTRGAASAQGFGEFAQATAANYIEDVFSTYLFTGTGANQTITNGIDLDGKGGLVWTKCRSDVQGNFLVDTVRGGDVNLKSNTTAANDTGSGQGAQSFTSTGYVTGGFSARTYVSWTFREQPKFFDVVTWSGDGTGDREISHNLGVAPGCILLKSTSTGGTNWFVYHRALSTPDYRYMYLQDTAAANTSGSNLWNVTSTTFRASSTLDANNNGQTFVAYLFAHDAGGFGLTGTDNVISCGAFTNSLSLIDVNLGYEAQWVLIKNTSAADDWYLFDNMRGMALSGTAKYLSPDLSNAESSLSAPVVYPTATGFAVDPASGIAGSSGNTIIYIAIRRGPMKVPTLGTSVFGLSARSGTGAVATVTGGQTDDAVIVKNRGSAVASLFSSRLTGTGYLVTSSTAVEVAAGATILQANPWDVMDGVKVGTTSTITNASANTFINYLFRRAPGFFDEVCYTGTGTNGQVINHNLSAIPEMVIIKGRDSNSDWFVYQAGLSSGNSIYLNRNYAQSNDGGPAFSLSTTAITISRTYVSTLNSSGVNYVAYLFATCAGVSKVGSYTGTGATQTINCGFGASGSRFVLIKRTDSTGDWYVWDSARGMISGTDPSLLLNSTAAEVNANSVYAISTGFQIVSTAAGINASAGTYIFLSVA